MTLTRFDRQNACRRTVVIAFLLILGCGKSKDSPSSATPENPPVILASIKAEPNPVPLGMEKFGKTTISWDTGDGSVAEVYVLDPKGEERRFSGALPKGSMEAAWIGKGEYEFRLYAGREHSKVLASIKVRLVNP